MTFDAGVLKATMTLDDSDFQRGTKNVERTSEKLNKNISSRMVSTSKKITVGLLGMGAVVTVTAGKLLKMGIQSSEKMEMLRADFDVLTGSIDKSADLFKRLNELGATTPFETIDLANATKTMLSFGIGSEDALKNLKMLGDVSLGNKEKLSGLSLAFSQVQSTGKLMGQDLLQMINQGFNPLTIISEKTGKSISQLKDEMAKGAISADMVTEAFTIATSEGGLFFNGMEKGSLTLQGRMSTLSDNVGILLRGIVGLNDQGEIIQGGLFSIFSKGVDSLIKLIDENKESIINLIQNGIKILINIANFLWPIIEKITSTIFDLSSKIIKNKDLLIAIAAGITAMLVPAFVLWGIAAGIAAVATIAAALPLIALGVAVGFLAYIIIKNWNFIIEKTKWLVDKIIDFFKFLWNFLFGNSIIPDIVEGFIKAFTFIKDIIVNSVQWMIDKVISLFNSLKDKFDTGLEFLKNIGKKIVDGLRSMPNSIGTTLGLVWDKFKDLVNKIKDIPNKIKEALDFRNLIKLPNISGALSGLKDKALSILPGRAAGGTVQAGQPYIVGEKRPELFVPDINGTIISDIHGSGGGGLATNNIEINIQGGNADARTLAAEIMRRLNREQELGRLGVTI